MEQIMDFHRRIAPNLLECDFVKKVVALQAFSNPEKGEKFHILLVGDPSCGKSDILMYMTGICPNSSYVGQKTTPQGLIEEIEDCDTGIMGVEEFDKIQRVLRNYLLEMMETQQIKITKHGMRRIVRARTNTLAVCNPRNYILNPMQPVHHQLTFSGEIALLTRFSLILPMKALDKGRFGDIAVSGNFDIDAEEERKKGLKRYLAKTRIANPVVKVDDEMARRAGEYIAELAGYSPMKDIISARTVKNGFMTALKASARMNFRDQATNDDFLYVKEIFEEAYHPD